MNGVIVEEKSVNDLGARGKSAVAAALRANSRLSWFALAVAVAAALGLYAPVVAGMAREWSEFPSLSHGFAVPVIAAYLLWHRRQLLAQMRNRLWVISFRTTRFLRRCRSLRSAFSRSRYAPF